MKKVLACMATVAGLFLGAAMEMQTGDGYIGNYLPDYMKPSGGK